MTTKKIKAIKGVTSFSIINMDRENHEYRQGYFSGLAKAHDLIYNANSNIKPMDILKMILSEMTSKGATAIAIDVDSKTNTASIDIDKIKIGGTIWVYAPW